MKRFLPVLLLAFLFAPGCAASVDLAGPEPPWHHGPEIDISVFYDALAPYGEWLWVEPWGWVWTPWDTYPGWRPYTDGRWAWTPLGWTWVSDWAWGWAPFHYGRWTHHPRHGWVWIPGKVWAPSWVAWRSGPGWIGWAPLPPDAHWRIGIGLDLGHLDLGVAIVERGWSFVEERHFLDERLRRRLAPVDHNREILDRTRDRTRYEEHEHRVAVRSFEPEEIEELAGTVRRYRIEDLDRPPRREVVDGGAVRIYRPEVKGEPDRNPERRMQPPSSTEKKGSERRRAVKKEGEPEGGEKGKARRKPPGGGRP